MPIQDIISRARVQLDRDPGLALYILRDTPELRSIPDLHEAVWEYFSPHYCGWIPMHEAREIIDQLEQSLEVS